MHLLTLHYELDFGGFLWKTKISDFCKNDFLISWFIVQSDAIMNEIKYFLLFYLTYRPAASFYLFVSSRYGSYYVSQMEHLKQTQSTEYNELVKNGLSIQAQDRYPLATACDQRGEQTINRDAKTTGMSRLFMVLANIVL